MEVKSYASSSKGNCYLISSDSTNILVDIGYSPTKLLKEVKPDALLITHHHLDHVSGLAVLKNIVVALYPLGKMGIAWN